MGTGIPERPEPRSGRVDRLPQLQIEHDEARAEDRAGEESVQRWHKPG